MLCQSTIQCLYSHQAVKWVRKMRIIGGKTESIRMSNVSVGLCYLRQKLVQCSWRLDCNYALRDSSIKVNIFGFKMQHALSWRLANVTSIKNFQSLSHDSQVERNLTSTGVLYGDARLS